MIYTSDLEYIETILNDPNYLSCKLTITTDEKGIFKGYIYCDGKIIFSHTEKSLEKVMKYLSIDCMKFIED